MAQQPEIVPQGTLQEKYDPRNFQAKPQRNTIELILVILVFLFVAFVFGVLVFASLNSVDNANKYLPVAPTTPK